MAVFCCSVQGSAVFGNAAPIHPSSVPSLVLIGLSRYNSMLKQLAIGGQTPAPADDSKRDVSVVFVDEMATFAHNHALGSAAMTDARVRLRMTISGALANCTDTFSLLLEMPRAFIWTNICGRTGPSIHTDPLFWWPSVDNS